MRFLFLFNLILTVSSFAGRQDSAPSSHLIFNDHFNGDIIINEVRVPIGGEARYTYYEALGWQGTGMGYAGIQTHPKGHNFIFSIWDNKAHRAPIQVVYRGHGTLTEKFGGEGTGLKSWNFELGWRTGDWQTLVSRCWLVGDNTQFGFWVRAADTGKWSHLVTMDVATANAWFRGGNDAFIEDWLSTGAAARTTHIRGGWKRKLDGTWFPVTKARYSVNKGDLAEGKRSYNFRTNWDGGISKDPDDPYFYMISGGAGTTPTTENPSMFTIPRAESSPPYPAIKIVDLQARMDGSTLTAAWETDSASLPQFAYHLQVFNSPACTQPPVITQSAILAHVRSHTLDLSDLDLSKGPYFLHLRCTDILDGLSEPRIIQLGNR